MVPYLGIVVTDLGGSNPCGLTGISPERPEVGSGERCAQKDTMEIYRCSWDQMTSLLLLLFHFDNLYIVD